MAKRKKRSEVPEWEGVEQFAGQAEGAGEEIVEFDEEAEWDAGLAKVEEAGDDVPGLKVEPELEKALEELEQRLGGAEAVLQGAQRPATARTAGLENIRGWGIGLKRVGGRVTGQGAVQVFVAEKLHSSQISPAFAVPGQVGGCPTDVEEVGDVEIQRFTRRERPAPGGSSIGHPQVTAGTLGCLVVRNNNRLCLLSNNHVIANSNGAQIGDPLLQPGRVDGGRMPEDRIGVLESLVPINFSGPNEVDAALGWTSFANASPRHHCYQIDPSPRTEHLYLTVAKCGRTTQHTVGVVVAVQVTIRVNFGRAGIALFRNQFAIRVATV